MSIVKQQPTSIVKDQPTSIVLGLVGSVAPTMAPETPTLAVNGRDAAIHLTISRVRGASGYRYQLRRWIAAPTNAWGSPAGAVDVMRQTVQMITGFGTSDSIENNRRYQVRVQAYNDIGDSSWSAWTEVLPLATLNAPTLAWTLGVNALNLAITAPTAGATPATYRYQFEQESSLGGFEVGRIRELAASTTSLRFTEFTDNFGESSDLINGRMYRIRFRSVDNSRPAGRREGEWSDWVEITYRTLNVPMFTLAAQSGQRVLITLTKVPNAIRYRAQLQKRNDADDDWIDDQNNPRGKTYSWTDQGATLTFRENTFSPGGGNPNEGLIEGRQYRWRFRAETNALQTDWSDWVEIRILRESRPPVPTFTLTGGSLQYTINIDRHDLATGFRYRHQQISQSGRRWSSTQGPFDAGSSRSITVTAFNTAGRALVPRRHRVQVQAYNNVGSSAFSDWMTVRVTN